MTAPFSLQPLLEIMQEKSDEATRRLGQLIAAEQNERQRLSMLENYRNEYAQGLMQASARGLTPASLANFRDFLGRIDEAINAQRDTVKRSENNTLNGKQNWQEQNQRLKAIDTLAHHHARREQQKENKREQKLLDEFSSRRFATALQNAHND